MFSCVCFKTESKGKVQKFFFLFAKSGISSKLEIAVHRKQKERARLCSKNFHKSFEVTKTFQESNLHTVKLPLIFQKEQSEAFFFNQYRFHKLSYQKTRFAMKQYNTLKKTFWIEI